ncbi:hypothetical protein BDZ90DRAFT_257026 [Jaminaea rosea]|uniref:Uncharacterized protein n=1 Tax=Jaminaea rosea TaxID=1569628 RepID=A0A316UXH2_9BASI|nr:hypothetical protein BDZ90DRAFT_257026 [Jaminaea rosea]PWN29912.1 hypothetical protein BDZ90DRAFT_257026 [Jaminaea rosea]
MPSPARAKDWTSSEELNYELQIYQGMVYSLVGIQFWEHMLTFEFEIAIFTGRAKWRHGMLAYLIIRYSTWAALIPMAININSTRPIRCEASLIALLIPFSLSTMTTSLMFVVRCIAVWEKNAFVICLLVPLWATEAALLLSSPARIHSTWTGHLCLTFFTRPMWEYNLAYLFVEIVDIFTFILTAWRLRTIKNVGIGRILFQQSVAYVFVATVLNTVCLALFYLALNPLMGYICTPMAMTLSGILACRAFRDLQRSTHKPERSFDGPDLNNSAWPPLSPDDEESAPVESEPQKHERGYSKELKHTATSTKHAHHSSGASMTAFRSGCGSHEYSRRRATPHQTLAERGRQLGQRDKEDWLSKSGLGGRIFDEQCSIFASQRPYSPSFLNMGDTQRSLGESHHSDTEPLRNDQYAAAVAAGDHHQMPTTLPLALKSSRSAVSTHTTSAATMTSPTRSHSHAQSNHGLAATPSNSSTLCAPPNAIRNKPSSHRLRDLETARHARESDEQPRRSHSYSCQYREPDSPFTASSIEAASPEAIVSAVTQYLPPAGYSDSYHSPASSTRSGGIGNGGRARAISQGDGGIHDYLSHVSQFLVPPRSGAARGNDAQGHAHRHHRVDEQRYQQSTPSPDARDGQHQHQQSGQSHPHQQQPRHGRGAVPYGQSINQGMLLWNR